MLGKLSTPQQPAALIFNCPDLKQVKELSPDWTNCHICSSRILLNHKTLFCAMLWCLKPSLQVKVLFSQLSGVLLATSLTYQPLSEVGGRENSSDWTHGFALIVAVFLRKQPTLLLSIVAGPQRTIAWGSSDTPSSIKPAREVCGGGCCLEAGTSEPYCLSTPSYSFSILSKAADSKGPHQRIPSMLIFPPWQTNQAKESGDKPNQMKALKQLHQLEEAKDKTMMSEVPLLWDKCPRKEIRTEKTDRDRSEHSTDRWK